MSIEYTIHEKNLKFLTAGMTGKMKAAVSVGIGKSLIAIERAHKKLFVLGKSKDPMTYPTKLVWRTGGLAQSYMSTWKRGDMMGAYGTHLKRGRILEIGGTIKAKNAAYLRFKIGDRWFMRKSVTIKGRFMMKQIAEDPKVDKAIDKIMADAMLKGIDDAG